MSIAYDRRINRPAVPRPWDQCWNIRSRATHEFAYSPGGGVSGADSSAPGPSTSVNGYTQAVEKATMRELAQALAQRLGVQPVFTGNEAPTAWLVDIGEAQRLFGPPAVPLASMLDWTADWVSRDMASLNKPTHYEARDGKY